VSPLSSHVQIFQYRIVVLAPNDTKVDSSVVVIDSSPESARKEE